MKAKKERPFGVTSGGEKLLYGIGDLGSNFVWTFVSSFLTIYYTDSVLMSAGIIGTIMLVTRLFDGVSDIFMGTLIEKTRTKMGKARPWFGGTIIPLVIIQLLVYNVPSSLSAGGKTAWIIITYFLLTVVFYTANNLSYHAMLSRISLDADDRNKVSSVRGIFSFMAGLVLAVLTPKLLAGFGGEKNQKAWTVVVVVYAILCFIFEGICFLGTKEKISCFDEEKTEKKAAPDIKLGLKTLLHTKYFYISVLVFICAYILNGMVLATSVYYSRDVLGNSAYYSIIAIVCVGFTVIGMAFAPKLFKKLGKKKTMIFGSILGVVGCVIGLTGATDFVRVVIATAVNGLALSPYVAGIFTFSPDIIELLEKKTGNRYEGLVTSVNSVGIKVGTGLASAFIGWGLALGAYDGALAVQNPSAITAEIVLLFGVPMVFNIISAILMSFWDMDKELGRKS